MLVFELRKLLFWNRLLQILVYAACWMLFFLLLMLLSNFSPKAAMWVMKLTQPISDFLKDLFWGFAPDQAQTVRNGAKLFGAIGRKILSRTSDHTQLAVHIGLLNGLLVVSIAAWITHFGVMIYVRRWLINQFVLRHSDEK